MSLRLLVVILVCFADLVSRLYQWTVDVIVLDRHQLRRSKFEQI